jgi:hypothetical protein
VRIIPFDVQFPDGHTEEYAANIIAENIYAQVDPEGNQFLLMEERIGHKKDSTAIEKDDMCVQHGTNHHMC